MTGNSQPSTPDWIALVLLVLVWGSSFILIKKSLVTFSSTEVGALRIAISFLVLIPWVIPGLRKIPANKLVFFLLSGVIGNGLPPFLFARAQTVIDSYLAGVLNSLTPLFTLLIGVFFFGIRTRWINVLGVIIGLGGAIGLLTLANGGSYGNAWYGLYVVLAAICYAINMNLIKNYLSGFGAMTIASVAFFFIGVPSMVFVFAGTDVVYILKTDPQGWESFGYIATLAVIGTAFAMVVHNWLIKRTSALFTSTVTYLMPVISILWGIADGENFLPVFLFWIGLILAGVYLANKRRVLPNGKLYKG